MAIKFRPSVTYFIYLQKSLSYYVPKKENKNIRENLEKDPIVNPWARLMEIVGWEKKSPSNFFANPSLYIFWGGASLHISDFYLLYFCLTVSVGILSEICVPECWLNDFVRSPKLEYPLPSRIVWSASYIKIDLLIYCTLQCRLHLHTSILTE